MFIAPRARPDMNIQREFGDRVRNLRKRAGLTQDQLAAKCGQGFVMQRIGEIERGQSNCTLQTVVRLSTALKCEPAELFLFKPKTVGKAMSLLDARLLDLWNAADERTKRKAIRILSELL